MSFYIYLISSTEEYFKHRIRFSLYNTDDEEL